MIQSLIYSTLYEIYFNKEFIGADFCDSDRRKRFTVAQLIASGFPKLALNGKAVFVSVEWESSEGWSNVVTEYAKTKVIRDTSYRLMFFNRGLARESPQKYALVWEPVGGRRKELRMNDKEKDHTVLLLGARHSGKTNFLFDLSTYLRFSDFDSFLQCQLCDVLSVSQPPTQDPSVFTYFFRDHLFTFIDSPGICSNLQESQKSLNSSLKSLSILRHFNAICIVFNPFDNFSEDSIRFQLNILLSYLPKEASHQISFVVTKGRSERTEKLIAFLRKICNEIFENTHNKVSVLDSNVFHFDNVASLAWHCDRKGILKRSVKEDYGRSWESSRTSLFRFLEKAALSAPVSAHLVDFVRQNRKKTRNAIREKIEIRKQISWLERRRRNAGSENGEDLNKIGDKIEILEKRRRNSEKECIECLQYLSRHAFVPRNNVSLDFIRQLQRNNLMNRTHFEELVEEEELLEELWDNARTSKDWDLSFFVCNRTIVDSQDGINFDQCLTQGNVLNSIRQENNANGSASSLDTVVSVERI
ncbi:hypothetical protein L596_015236 [Steinernema carpocapsae]|uniref:G domain-containing protein n=1 Tax=Steinernema carpocapsae TaxID=34508 RepID=A0A4U5NFD8_STECR|nr:hypothetical protein L596_015236 [Steinernema carpocapsae]